MADYKFNTITSERISWTASNGQKADLEVALIEELIDYDFIGKWSRKSLDIKTAAYLDGKSINSRWVREISHPNFVAVIGNIGLTADKYDQYQQLYKKIESHPEWQKKLLSIKNAADIDDKYRQLHKKIALYDRDDV